VLNGHWVDLAYVIIAYGVIPFPSIEGDVAKYYCKDYLDMYDMLVGKLGIVGCAAKINELRPGIDVLDDSKQSTQTLTKFKNLLNLKDNVSCLPKRRRCSAPPIVLMHLFWMASIGRTYFNLKLDDRFPHVELTPELYIGRRGSGGEKKGRCPCRLVVVRVNLWTLRHWDGNIPPEGDWRDSLMSATRCSERSLDLHCWIPIGSGMRRRS